MSIVKEYVKRHIDPHSRLYETLRLTYALATWQRPVVKQVRRRLLRDGVFHEDSELWMCSLLPSDVLNRLMSRVSVRSTLDVGCGTGQSLGYFVDRGVEAWGIEGSALAASRSNYAARITVANLNRPIDLGRRFDLVWSFEVAEHIHGRHADTFVRTCARHGDRIVLSAAQPGQGGEGHLNEQPPEYWIERFGRAGFRLERELTDYLRASPDEHAKNLLAFERAHHDVRDVHA